MPLNSVLKFLNRIQVELMMSCWYCRKKIRRKMPSKKNSVYTQSGSQKLTYWSMQSKRCQCRTQH